MTRVWWIAPAAVMAAPGAGPAGEGVEAASRRLGRVRDGGGGAAGGITTGGAIGGSGGGAGGTETAPELPKSGGRPTVRADEPDRGAAAATRLAAAIALSGSRSPSAYRRWMRLASTRRHASPA